MSIHSLSGFVVVREKGFQGVQAVDFLFHFLQREVIDAFAGLLKFFD